jgi:hypothetical protein
MLAEIKAVALLLRALMPIPKPSRALRPGAMTRTKTTTSFPKRPPTMSTAKKSAV